MRYLARIVPLMALATLALLWARPSKAADPIASFEVMVVQASKQPGPIDPRVEQKHFREFAYKSFQVVGQQSPNVTLGTSQTVPLAGDKQLTVSFQKHAKTSATVHLSIPGVVDSTVTLRPGGQVILGGPKMPYGNGVLFVPVKLTQLK